ncbi:NAD-binding protein [Phormidium sp. CLA17]|uniref:NAD-binding protein n=1 Tax=Leptolyngbya sp. Cla-17 TaxID=2803751 RepID=UPI001490A42F|nr:NAD-binding protein [Leptolyngbya sp. Cla-17]MBM0741452.1 NAD-binding protein [Leptolyngbya sp. Cla-17]
MPVDSVSTQSPQNSLFLVCGLGSLGQFCVSVLKEFGVLVSAITLTQPLNWEVNQFPELLENLLIGDCRQADLLEKAGVKNCRAVLLVASDERVNIEAAFEVRLLNPGVRIIVRSAKENLNDLVAEKLGNFVAFEATQLPAPAFAIAALNSEVCGFITLEESLLRVTKLPIYGDHRWCYRLLHELNTQTRRVLSYTPKGTSLSTEFYQLNPDIQVQPGDQIAYVEIAETLTNFNLHSHETSAQKALKKRDRSLPFWKRLSDRFSKKNLTRQVADLWSSIAQQQTKRVALIVGVMLLLLLILGTLVLIRTRHVNFPKAFYTVAIMLLGADDAVFSALKPEDETPLWMRLMNLTYMLAGTASIAVLYALLTETLLSAKFQLPKKRPAIPDQNHVVLIGLGRVGRRVATFLQQIKQPLVGISDTPLEATVLPLMSLKIGDLATSLSKVNLETAKSVVVATDDEMANLEIGLMAHRINPNCAVVIRTFSYRFSASVDRLLPYAKVLCAYDLAAEAYVAAAFGENILSLMRVNEQTVLVTDYSINENDTLHGRLLAEIAYGYGVVPILHQRYAQNARLMPLDESKTEVGDRLIVMATIDSLQRVERGELLPRTWTVHVEQTLSKDAVFDCANAIARISDCGIQLAREVMSKLPAALPIPLYQHQALRLVRELRKCQAISQAFQHKM